MAGLLGLLAGADVQPEELLSAACPAEFIAGSVKSVVVMPVDASRCNLRVSFPTSGYDAGAGCVYQPAVYTELLAPVACDAAAFRYLHQQLLAALAHHDQVRLRTQINGANRFIVLQPNGYLADERIQAVDAP
ncbi:MAG: hypothetical protein EPO25_06805 [Gammaproteobacteria bacterium]|nr:MAG: hypothetical protein EPO25_06805 [Gammaproteobacteria bacterium]